MATAGDCCCLGIGVARGAAAATMLVLFETSAGYALFSVKNDGKLQDVNNLYKEFESPEKAKKL